MESVNPIKDPKKLELFLSYMRGSDTQGKYYMISVLGFNTGLRVGDILKIKYEDIWSDGRFREYLTIREEKTNKRRNIKLAKELKEELRAYALLHELEIGDYLFYVRGNKRKSLRRTIVWRRLSEAAQRVGIESFGCHSLRKTFGYLYYQKTKDIATLQALFNHSSSAVTLRYIGLTQDKIDKTYLEVGALISNIRGSNADRK